MEVFGCYLYIALLISTGLGLAASHSHGNPADELVDIINKNRTAHNSSLGLYDNPGLGCMALQYIETYNGKCEQGKSPPEVDITEVFAPDCGVELPTVQTISGRLLGCELHYAQPAEAFSQLLIKNKKRLSTLYDGNHTEVGVGVSGTNGGGPYFWCVLFGSGQPNSTFELEGGQALKQKEGCFSGTGVPCSASAAFSASSLSVQALSLSLFLQLYVLVRPPLPDMDMFSSFLRVVFQAL